MSLDSTADPGGLPLDQVPGATGHVILAEGADDGGADEVAVWHVSASGIPVGAWIKPVHALADDPAAAEQLLRLTSHRALVGWDAGVAEPLRRLAHWAKRQDPQPTLVLLPEVLAEVTEHRHTHAAAVEQHQAGSKSKIAPLVWRHDVSEAGSWSQFVDTVRLARPQAASPVAAEALHLVRAVAWVAALWHDTETVRTRRSYLVERFGPAAPLPPQWLARLRQAHSLATG
jgi:hypothetical protein